MKHVLRFTVKRAVDIKKQVDEAARKRFGHTNYKILDAQLERQDAADYEQEMVVTVEPEGEQRMADQKDHEEVKTILIGFESGHYKKVTGQWKGDSVWTHFIKENGKAVHVNKDKVEYYEEI